MHSIIKNPGRYLHLLYELLSGHDIIHDPKQLFELIEVSEYKGKIMGWQIKDKEIKFQTEDFMDCDEAALLKGDRYVIDYFSYHFSPSSTSMLKSYRIDLNNGDLHLNPDSSLEDDYSHIIYPEQLYFDIRNFNCILAIRLALLYIDQQIYPADPQAKKYDIVLEGERRKLA